MPGPIEVLAQVYSLGVPRVTPLSKFLNIRPRGLRKILNLLVAMAFLGFSSGNIQ